MAYIWFRVGLVLALVQWSLRGVALGQINDAETACASKESCGTCIQTKECQWCSRPAEENVTIALRCTLAAAADHTWCPGYVVNPISEDKTDKAKIKPISKTVQITPQRVKLRLRVDQTFDLHMHYAHAQDYPVDLYFLMDLSASMADDKTELSTLGDKLAEVMSNITSNFRLGFGSFVDKVVMPYSSTVPAKLASPCTVPNTTKTPCAPPYSFKNHMPLSEKTKLFSDSVKDAPVSGNLDNPEGGFDALMQAIVCHKEIGWREKARHLIIFSTDAGFHIAGDGRLGGIVLPNDAQCHMQNDEYPQAYAVEYDYPSISQINQKAKENNMNLIFAVTDQQINLYKMLAERIKGASYGVLDDGSSNVVKLVRDEYNKIVDSVVLSHNASDAVEVRFFSKCLASGQEEEVNKCDGLRVNTSVSFTAKIRVIKCPEDKSKWTQTLEIKPVAINESLIVEIEIICGCDCEVPNNPGYEPHSKACSGKGTSQCGVCSCADGFVGRKCECAGNSVDNTQDLSGCKADNSSSVVCSGRGSCKCGVCGCNQRTNANELIYGKLCECDNFSCTRSGNLLCSGSDHGTCNCGQCTCHSGWDGDACECPNANSTCISQGKVCSGQGDCVCGECNCHFKGKFKYSGKFCEECPTCAGQRCDELRSCIECRANAPAHSSSECDFKCEAIDPPAINVFEMVDRVEAQDDSKGEHVCRSPDNAGCTLVFMYKYVEGSLLVYAQRTRECGSDDNVLGLVLGVTGGTVIIGLLLLIAWKVITSIHDKREYSKFEKERALSKWDRGDNPLYKPSTSTFSNPTFGGQ